MILFWHKIGYAVVYYTRIYIRISAFTHEPELNPFMQTDKHCISPVCLIFLSDLAVAGPERGEQPTQIFLPQAPGALVYRR